LPVVNTFGVRLILPLMSKIRDLMSVKLIKDISQDGENISTPNKL